MISIYILPILLLWILNFSKMWNLENRKNLFLINFTLLVLSISSCLLFLNISSYEIISINALFILFHPIILFIYLLAVRKKSKPIETNNDILDEDF